MLGITSLAESSDMIDSIAGLDSETGVPSHNDVMGILELRADKRRSPLSHTVGMFSSSRSFTDVRFSLDHVDSLSSIRGVSTRVYTFERVDGPITSKGTSPCVLRGFR